MFDYAWQTLQTFSLNDKQLNGASGAVAVLHTHGAKNYGFLHPNSKQLIQLLQYLLKLDVKKIMATIKPCPQFTCPCCGAFQLKNDKP